MSISYYKKPTSFNITYTAPHANLAPSELAKVENHNKLLFIDGSGNVAFYDGGLLLDIETYPDLASFPAEGETNKFYLDQSENKMYRWANSQYYYFPYDVYSKNESDTNYYNKTSLYTKTEADTKYTIRANTNNDMTGSQINNLTALTVANALNANQTAISFSKPVNCGWQNISFVTQINDKIQLDESNTKLLTSLNMNGNDLLNVDTINADVANVTTANFGATTLSGALNMGNNNVSNVNTLTATTANLGATTLSGALNMGNNNVSNVNALTATSATVGATSLTGNLNMNSNNINNVNAVTASTASLGATSLTGALNMNTNNINNVNALTAVSANLGTTTLAGNLSMGSNNISAVATTTTSTLEANNVRINDGGALTLGVGNVTRENNSGTIKYKPDYSPSALAIVGASFDLTGTEREIELWDHCKVIQSLTAPKVRTDNIRLQNDTDMITMGASFTTNGGANEINVKGRVRFNMNSNDDQSAIYTFVPLEELHILGYGVDPSRAVRIYDNLTVQSSITTPIANITTSNFTTGNITTATIGTANITTENTTTATIGTANITTENTTTANITTANVTTGNFSTVNVSSASGINGKVRFDGAGMDLMTDTYFNNNDLIGIDNVSTQSLTVQSASGINGKIRFNSGVLDIIDNAYMNSHNIYDANRVDCVEIETPNGTVLPTNHIPLATKTTWAAGSGNILYEYTAPTNYEIYSAQFTAGTTVISTSFMGGNTASAYYDDALGYGAMITGRFVIRYAL